VTDAARRYPRLLTVADRYSRLLTAAARRSTRLLTVSDRHSPSSDGPNADKRKGVLLLLADAERSQWSDGEIAPARAPGARAPVAQTEGDQPGRMKSRTNSCVSRDTFRRSMPTWTGHEMAGELSLSDPQVDKRTPAR